MNIDLGDFTNIGEPPPQQQRDHRHTNNTPNINITVNKDFSYHLRQTKFYIQYRGWEILAACFVVWFVKVKVVRPLYHDYKKKCLWKEVTDPKRVDAMNKGRKQAIIKAQTEQKLKSHEFFMKQKEKEAERRRLLAEQVQIRHRGGNKLGAAVGSSSSSSSRGAEIETIRTTQQEYQTQVSIEKKLEEDERKQKEENVKKLKKNAEIEERRRHRLARPTVGHLQYAVVPAVAEMPTDSQIIQEQNARYEESLRRDQEKDLIRKQFQDALEMLQDEPDDGDVVYIIFRLPRRCKDERVTRRFKPLDSIDQILYFLRTCDQLSKIKNWMVKDPLNRDREIITSSYDTNATSTVSTILDLGLGTRGLLHVIDLDA